MSPVSNGSVAAPVRLVSAAIIIDRLRGVQGLNVTGVAPLPSREGGKALEHFEEGLAWLQKRTRDRISRGVEGKPVA